VERKLAGLTEKQKHGTSEHRDRCAEAKRADREKRAAWASGESTGIGIYLTVDPHPPSTGSARITKTQQPNRTAQIRNTARRKNREGKGRERKGKKKGRTGVGAMAVWFDVTDRSKREADERTLRHGSTAPTG